MISDADLLQANATLITGILIFLTIAPFSGDVIRQVIEKRIVLWTVYITIGVLLASTLNIFFSTDSPQDILFLSKAFTAGGIVGIMAAVMFVLSGLPRIRREQKES
jgi:hypothetical protein